MGRCLSGHPARDLRARSLGTRAGPGDLQLSPAAFPVEGRIIAWYGDDFTGAAAVLEALTFGGIDSVLFFDVPTQSQLDRFAHCRGVGIAGVSRSKSPTWMDRELPRFYRALRGLDAPITQYKVCSTFDSSPETGSIGRAFEIGATILDGAWFPLLVAAPIVQRYQAFGNLFATVSGSPYRLDRHPTMSRHPVTPMTEADVRVHLSRQTARSIGLIDIVTMKRRQSDGVLAAAIARGERLVALDAVDDETLREAGRIIWENRGERLFAIGSQGLEYALLAYWHDAGVLSPALTPKVPPVARIVAVSGSCSPVTAEQISWAEEHGFQALRLDVVRAADPPTWEAYIDHAIKQVLDILSTGHDPIAFTAMGPNDRAIAALRTAVKTRGEDMETVSNRIGIGLGRLLAEVLRQTGISRGIIAGGDTSSYATSAFGICALTAVAPTVAGAALFQAHSEDCVSPRLEIALKGGQMGSVDYFARIKKGD